MRGKQAKNREVQPDLIYSSKLVTRLTNKVMQHGKKTIAQ
jgi:ribosomal protein S7